jgi:hypothetical protein
MKLTAIEPSAAGQDLRTFTCPECKRVQRHIIESAVTEAWLKPHATSRPVAESSHPQDPRRMTGKGPARDAW